MKKFKIIASTALAVAMLATSSFAGAAVLDDGQIEPYGEIVNSGDIGAYKYKDPSVTVSENIGSSFEAKYDLREKGLVTGVKDQDAHNFCWAFASLASMESNLLKKKVIKQTSALSEAHLAFFHFNGSNRYSVSRYAGTDSFKDTNDEFSNYLASGATLARGYGAVNDSLIPYSEIANKSGFSKAFRKKYDNDKTRTARKYMMEDMSIIETAQTTKKLDIKGMNNVKALIKKNGGIASVVYSPSPYMEPEKYKAAYGDVAMEEITNFYSTTKQYDHGVTVVGWDDNYPKDSFNSSTKPAGDGAWLIKNSYGTDFGKEKGYFWASYYNPSISLFASFTGAKKDKRQTYQYDGVGFGDDMSSAPKTKKRKSVPGANVFKARKDILLDQAVVSTPVADSVVNVKIFAYRNGKAPSKGTRLYNKTFTVKNAPLLKQAGSHTLKLGRNVGIPKGMYFATTVSISSKQGKGTALIVPFEMKYKYKSDIKSGKLYRGMSYAYQNGKWYDMSKQGYEPVGGNQKARLFNAIIKVRGKDAGIKAQKIKARKHRTVKKHKKVKIRAKRVRGNGKLVYQTSNSKKATVTTKGVVKAKKKGTVKITVRTLPTSKYKSAKKVIKIKIK